MDADTKLIPTFLVGFMQDLASRLASRIQLTTNGHKMYVVCGRGCLCRCRRTTPCFRRSAGLPGDTEHRYSTAGYVDCQKHPVAGCPDEKHASTSYVERHNLTLRMSLRRYTRLTNAHNRKLRNHTTALRLLLCFCNLTSRMWSVAEAIGLLDRPATEAADSN